MFFISMKKHPSKCPGCKEFLCLFCHEAIDKSLDPERVKLDCRHKAHTHCYLEWYKIYFFCIKNEYLKG